MKSKQTEPLEVLTRATAATEPAVQKALAEVLEGCAPGVEAILQHQTGDGPCDLFLPGRRIVIEVKRRPARSKPPVAGPDSSGSQEGETQFEQLQRYVLALRGHEQRTMWRDLRDANTPWIGALTDGVRWWAWEWSARREDDVCAPHQALHKQQFDRSPEALREAAVALATRAAGKPWVPADPAGLFDALRRDLDEIWNSAAASAAAITQHHLWHDLVRGSGIEVAEHRRIPLFLDHCLLVMVARNVTRILDGSSYAEPADGFISWIADAPGGAQWAHDLFTLIDRYDWGAREADVLRNVYMAIVPKEDRKLYGEYYTPDWLANLIVEETLDDKWLEGAILAARSAAAPPDKIGVLDPACGSGTFLYHAARRVLAAIPKYAPSANDEEKARIVSRLVHGIDIHPVAVEMARATLRRALPAPAETSVHQGDALLMESVEIAGLTQPMLDAGTSRFWSPDRKRYFAVPYSFTNLPNFETRLDMLVAAACDGLSLPADVTLGASKIEAKQLADAHEVLTQIVAEHGNGVWAWYIRNQLAPHAIARRKVNRIVSNPPWLRWNEIQTEPRKENVRALARERGILPGTQGSHSSFDLGAVFVVETRNLFLARPRRDASAFVLNAAALTSENWRSFREQGHLRGVLDVSERHPDERVLRPRPFSGADACVIGLRNKRAQRLVLNDPKRKFDPSVDALPAGLTKRIAALPQLPWAPSQYAASARNGTTVQPAVLVKVDPDNPKRTLQPQRAKQPWAKYSPFALEDIPDQWRVGYVAPTNLVPFSIREPLAEAVVPNNGEYLLTDEEARSASSTWAKLDTTYRRHVGGGATTPSDLVGKLDYRKQLSSQWHPTLNVVYNGAGQRLRAATATEIIEHTFYRVAVDSQAEGDYLCAFLNAPCLSFAFEFARKSGRHFDKTPLEKIPIPLYSPANADHKRLAELSASIRESRSAKPDFRYPDDCAAELAAIDKIVAKLLPDFARARE